MTKPSSFDVIVVGAGHAGVEAAFAAARAGCEVGLCTLSPDTVAEMPCNPAIGGTAKGHLVREIDALGGLMGEAIDATGVQFKLLNRSRGPAVWSPRAQADKRAYSRWVRARLQSEPKIHWIIGRAGAIVAPAGKVIGLEMEDGTSHRCDALIITTGTFLDGVVHVGSEQRPAGRHGEPPSVALARSIRSRAFSVGRLKTGTPPRLSARSIDFDGQVRTGAFIEERGDDVPVPFSFGTQTRLENTLRCWQLYTNGLVRDVVRRNIEKSPLYNGRITGVGPRYCPSLEDKIMRFADRERHQLYLEPEGEGVDEIYVNGLSMSLPVEVQKEVVRALPGLEDAEMIRPGYAVEYDFVNPVELKSTLESHRLPGLFFAGQINGTSGYEEAAGQGLVAGVNAARKALGLSPFVLQRTEAYIGVMVDDLVSKGCLEPYRMFTSRAEHRLLLRIDNADLRLTPIARSYGLISDQRWAMFESRRGRYEANARRLDETLVATATGDRVAASVALRQQGVTLADLLSKGAIQLDLDGAGVELDILSLEVTAKYSGYLKREAAAAARLSREEARRIPDSFPFGLVPGLSAEMVQRFSQVRPETLAQASRIPGVTPAAIAVLGTFLTRLGQQPQQTT